MAGVLAPVATQVGLQIILKPYSHTIGNIACTAVGVVYPAYASFKAVEVLRLRNETEEAARWLTYWAIYGALTSVERILDKLVPWVPYYSTLKLGLLLWLQVPRYSGAIRLSAHFIRPFLHRTHAHIDACLAALRHSLNRPELVALANALNDALAHVPVLEWFVRGPDGRPVSGPRGPRRPPSGFITG